MTQDEATAPEARFGAYLERERELRGLSVEQVAAFTKLGIDQIRALESGTWDVFAAHVYLRGAVRNYARAVGLDPAEVLLRLEDEVEPREPQAAWTLETDSALERPISVGSRDWVWRAVVWTLVISVLVMTFVIIRGRRTPIDVVEPGDGVQPLPVTQPVTAPVTTAVTASATAVTPPPIEVGVQEHELRIYAVEESWIAYRVDTGDKRDLILPQGRTYRLKATQEIWLKAGNAGGVEVSLDGGRGYPLGASGVVRTKTWTFPEVP